jgi:hypothetical protein
VCPHVVSFLLSAWGYWPVSDINMSVSENGEIVGVAGW